MNTPCVKLWDNGKNVMHIVFLGIALCFYGVNPCLSQTKPPESEHASGGNPMNSASEQTLITPLLNQPLEKGKNLLYCATLQLAWDELRAAAGEPIRFEDEPPLAAELNRLNAADAKLDRKSCLSVAGIVNDALLAKIAKEFPPQFSAQAVADIASLPKGSLVAYAYLEKILPFQWAFTRFETPLQFDATDVASFGITQYFSKSPTAKKMAAQVNILDYVTRDDFMIELQTTSKSDRLFLAKIAPDQTLQATVTQALQRIAKAKPTRMRNLETLVIPVMDVDLLKNYPELCGRKIVSVSALNGKQFNMAAQQIRFKLDETGALLESTVFAASALSQREFIFDKPFLLLLTRKNAKMPYLALWVENSAFMVPFK